MESNLTFIHLNYGFLLSTITKLESQGVSLTDSVSTVMFTKNKLEEVAGDVGMKVNTKFNQVLAVRFRPSSREHVLIALRSPYWQRLMTVIRSLLRNTYLMGL
jgi:hypothetical protein